MDGCVLEFILFFIVEDDAILVNKIHDWSFPTWRTEQIGDIIEYPVTFWHHNLQNTQKKKKKEKKRKRKDFVLQVVSDAPENGFQDISFLSPLVPFTVTQTK